MGEHQNWQKTFSPTFRFYTVLTLQFISARKAGAGALVVWADLTKFGRLSTSDLKYVVTATHKALSKMPSKSAAVILAPHLVSEKVSGGQRGEIRPRVPFQVQKMLFFNWLPSLAYNDAQLQVFYSTSICFVLGCQIMQVEDTFPF